MTMQEHNPHQVGEKVTPGYGTKEYTVVGIPEAGMVELEAADGYRFTVAATRCFKACRAAGDVR